MTGFTHCMSFGHKRLYRPLGLSTSGSSRAGIGEGNDISPSLDGRHSLEWSLGVIATRPSAHTSTKFMSSGGGCRGSIGSYRRQ